ncbi:hypothetical protein DYB28_015500, partial [Aphanomyces astaci]
QCLVNVFNVSQAVTPAKFVAALGRLSPFVGFIAASLAYGLYSPSDVLHSHPRLLLWTIGLISCKVHEEAVLYGVSAGVVAVYVHMVYFVVTDLTAILKIKVFTVKEKQ